jgi:hypothetical protein
LTSSSLIVLYLPVVLDVLRVEELLDVLRSRLDSRPQTWPTAEDGQLDGGATPRLPSAAEQLTQGVLDHGIEASMSLRRVRLHIDEQLILDPHCGPPHVASVCV